MVASTLLVAVGALLRLPPLQTTLSRAGRRISVTFAVWSVDTCLAFSNGS